MKVEPACLLVILDVFQLLASSVYLSLSSMLIFTIVFGAEFSFSSILHAFLYPVALGYTLLVVVVAIRVLGVYFRPDLIWACGSNDH